MGLRSRYGVTVMGVKRPGADFKYAVPETVIPRGCTLIVAGRAPGVERFAAGGTGANRSTQRRPRRCTRRGLG
jgi:K+/H+ antiporter YhaU regulatory subunit KhtT